MSNSRKERKISLFSKTIWNGSGDNPHYYTVETFGSWSYEGDIKLTTRLDVLLREDRPSIPINLQGLFA